MGYEATSLAHFKIGWLMANGLDQLCGLFDNQADIPSSAFFQSSGSRTQYTRFDTTGSGKSDLPNRMGSTLTQFSLRRSSVFRRMSSAAGRKLGHIKSKAMP